MRISVVHESRNVWHTKSAMPLSFSNFCFFFLCRFTRPIRQVREHTPLSVDHFKMYELVDIMRQKDDLKLAQLLNRLRLNGRSEDDKNELRKRVVDRHLGDYTRDAIHLFAEKTGLYEHNENIMNHMEVEKVVIPCHDTVVSANISPKKAQELISQVPDDVSITANLEKFLTVAFGMKYVMSVNVNVEDGLTNGATGVVKFVEYKIEGMIPELAKQQEKTFQRGCYNSNIQRDWTPVFEVERTYVYIFKMYQRIKFPLRAVAAKSVHKAQWIIKDEIVVDLTQYNGIRKVSHIHRGYIAFSRIRKLENLYILNLNEVAIHLDVRVTVEMQNLRTQTVLQLSYTPLYKIDFCKIKSAFNNARSLHKYCKDKQWEPNVLAAGVIGFAESRLCTRDDLVGCVEA